MKSGKCDNRAPTIIWALLPRSSRETQAQQSVIFISLLMFQGIFEFAFNSLFSFAACIILSLSQ